MVSSAQMSTQKIVLWIFLVSKLPDKIPKPYLQPFGHPHHKVKNRRFAPKVEQTLSLDLVSPSFLPKAGILLVGIFKWCGHHCGWDLRRLHWACSDKVESKSSAKPQGLKIQQVFFRFLSIKGKCPNLGSHWILPFSRMSLEIWMISVRRKYGV